ncbi:MAG: hypothetical protein IGQ45_13180 [Cyanobacterium sp. T60_A2020_053]|nr:hypothetical protein [Cyanobacterium sp. T60_A2020_053]
MISSYMAIWYAKIPLSLQGRVMGADYFIGIVVATGAGLTAGVLADVVEALRDQFFELWLQSPFLLGQPKIITDSGKLVIDFTAVITAEDETLINPHENIKEIKCGSFERSSLCIIRRG